MAADDLICRNGDHRIAEWQVSVIYVRLIDGGGRLRYRYVDAALANGDDIAVGEIVFVIGAAVYQQPIDAAHYAAIDKISVEQLKSAALRAYHCMMTRYTLIIEYDIIIGGAPDRRIAALRQRKFPSCTAGFGYL